MENIVEKIHKQIKKQLNNFTNSTVKSDEKEVTYKHRLSGDYEIWRLARYIFSEILLFNVSDQPMEKINWWISFVYKNKYNCSIAHQKFGFRIYVSANTEAEAKDIAENLEKILHKSLQDLMPLIEYYAQDALSKGQIIVDNNFMGLFRSYDFFQNTTLHKKKLAEKSHSKIIKKGNVTIIKSNKAFLEIPYYEQATIFSFFSMLEHLCVLFLAFRKIPERNNVAKFSDMRWSDKFKIVFDIKQPEFKDIYDKLICLARYRRNPEAHGGTYTVFSFYLKGARHKLSCTLHDKIVSIQWKNQENNFNIMESFINLIKKHSSTRNIFLYIESGFNVSFGEGAVIENDMISSMSKKDILEYIEFTTRRYDDMANMDW